MAVSMNNPPQVLLIEDNPLDVRLLRERCKEDPNWNIRFDVAASLAEGARAMAANRHDAILLDLGLPESDGLETLERMLKLHAEHAPDSAIIVLTSVTSDATGEEAIAMGAQDYLVKGAIDAGQIKRAIRYACERQRMISERRQAHERLTLMATALDQASDTVIITNRDGEICYVNQAFTKITGYSAEEALGQSPAMLSSGKQSPAFYHRMWSAITAGKQWEAEMIDRRKNGEYYPCHLEIAPVSDDQGNITHFVGIQRDLTEHKLLENQLLQSQKMEAIGTLTGGIAHDFNNMLAGITGNLFLARRKIDDRDKLKQRLDAIEGLCDRATTIIKQLMAFGRNDMVQMAPLTLNGLVRDVHKMMTSLLPESIRLPLEICDQPLTVVGDTTQLHQVLLNLFNNARDAVADNPIDGEIRCTLAPYTPDDGYLKLHPEAANQCFARITIHDNGCGVEADTLQHLTEPFYTTKEVGAGTGLGLSMVVGAVDQHHGILTLDGAPGEGMRVTIDLPLIGDQGAVAGDIHEQDFIPGNGETILIADDEAAVRDMLTSTLSFMGYRVISANNGARALALFRQHRADIRLVLLDVVMPEMGGPESYRRMREIFFDLPVIFASGYERTGIPSELLAAPYQRCLRKPFSPTHLSELLHTMLT